MPHSLPFPPNHTTPRKKGEAETPRDHFNAATFGHYCRSSSFARDGQERWIEAIQTAPAQWTMFQVSVELDTQTQDTKRGLATRIKLGGSQNFYDVVSRIAEYENLHSDQAVEYLRLQGPKELGYDHYIAFATREGIPFDAQTGKPLQTFNGLIIETAQIDYDTMKAVREAWEAKQMLFLTPVGGLNPDLGLPIDLKSLDAVCLAIEDCEKVKKIVEGFNKRIQSFKDMAEKKQGGNVTIAHFQFDTLRADIAGTFEEETPQIALRLQQYATLIELYAALYIAKESFAKFYKEGAAAETVKTDVLSNARKIKDYYNALGGEPVSVEQIAADIIRMNNRSVLNMRADIPPAIEKIAGTLQEMQARTDEIKTNYRVIALGKKDMENLTAGRINGTAVGTSLADLYMTRKL